MPPSLKVRFTRERLVIALSWVTVLRAVVCAAAVLAAWLAPLPGLEPTATRIAFVIFALAAALWITELIPPYATSIIVIVLSVYLLGRPGGPLGLEDHGPLRSWEMFINPVASPVLVLFFGGLTLASAATKHGFDVRLARAFVTPFGRRPHGVLFGILATTALFSMFMSNTACTAMMLAVVAPLLQQIEGRQALKKSLVLAIPFAANIGGIGTILGTPPNAVAAIALQQLGPQHGISFLGWMLFGAPFVVVMVAAAWSVLVLVLRPDREPLDLVFPAELEVTPSLAIVVATFALTILLWLTEPLHGLPPAVVALLPVAVFAATGIITRDDLKQFDWDVLILLAGGMTLGVVLRVSGLSDVLVAHLRVASLPEPLLIVVIALLTVLASNFMSHTAGTNLLVPIVLSLGDLPPKIGALAVAVAASLSMSLPISTPPNAMAYATRQVTSRDIIICGTLVSLIGIALLVAILSLAGGWVQRL